MTNKNQLDQYIKETQIIVDRTHFGCGYDQCAYETKYVVEAINYEKGKVKLLPIAKRTVVLWGSDYDGAFTPLEEKPFWASITLDAKHLFLYNRSRDFSYYRESATK